MVWRSMCIESSWTKCNVPFNLRNWSQALRKICSSKGFRLKRICLVHKLLKQKKLIAWWKSISCTDVLVGWSWKISQDRRQCLKSHCRRKWWVLLMQRKRVTNWCLGIWLVKTYWIKRESRRKRESLDWKI